MEFLFLAVYVLLPWALGIYALVTIVRISKATKHIARRVDEMSARLGGDDGASGP